MIEKGDHVTIWGQGVHWIVSELSEVDGVPVALLVSGQTGRRRSNVPTWRLQIHTKGEKVADPVSLNGRAQTLTEKQAAEHAAKKSAALTEAKKQEPLEDD